MSDSSRTEGVEMRADVIYGKGSGHDLALDLFLPKEALQAAGVPVELVSVEGQPHGFFNKSPFRESTYAKMLEWMRRRFPLST
jgi:alpha-beta hydrolase superfamily lysophospholipase